MTRIRNQRTILCPVAVAGYGYWSGKDVRVEFRPAPAGAGITFVRDDLHPAVRIPARYEHRIEIPRRTCLYADGAQVDMVEHILAALAGLQIDNCELHVDEAEMPGCDGSALAFVSALAEAGTVTQGVPIRRLVISERFCVRDGDSWIEARPNRRDEFTIQYTVNYPQDAVIGLQVAEVTLAPEVFVEEIAPCRTFMLQREAERVLQQGLGKRVRTQDLLILGSEGPIDNQLRFTNECARHKALDVIGDMALTGCEIVGTITAYRSGHRLNVKFAQELMKRFAGQRLMATA